MAPCAAPCTAGHATWYNINILLLWPDNDYAIIIVAEGTPHRYKIIYPCSRVIMEEFSEAAKANAFKFLAEFSDKPVPTIKEDAPPPLPLHWPRIADDELEGTVLDMARCYLAVKWVVCERKCQYTWSDTDASARLVSELIAFTLRYLIEPTVTAYCKTLCVRFYSLGNGFQ